jgi:hypothetical protein
MSYIFAKCPHCEQKNNIEREKLEENSEVARGLTVFRGQNDTQEYRVVCQHCFKPFKIRLPKTGQP